MRMFWLVRKSELDKRLADKDAEIQRLKERYEAEADSLEERSRIVMDSFTNKGQIATPPDGAEQSLKERSRIMEDALSDIFDFTMRHFRNDLFMRHVLMQCCQGLRMDFLTKFKEATQGEEENKDVRMKRHEVYGNAESANDGYDAFVRNYPKDTKKPCPTPFEWMYLDGDENDTRISAKAERDCKLVKDLISSPEVAEAYLKSKNGNDGMATGYYHQAAEFLFESLTEQLRQSVHDVADLVANRNRG